LSKLKIGFCVQTHHESILLADISEEDRLRTDDSLMGVEDGAFASNGDVGIILVRLQTISAYVNRARSVLNASGSDSLCDSR
jgi:hypothetical protein